MLKERVWDYKIIPYKEKMKKAFSILILLIVTISIFVTGANAEEVEEVVDMVMASEKNMEEISLEPEDTEKLSEPADEKSSPQENPSGKIDAGEAGIAKMVFRQGLIGVVLIVFIAAFVLVYLKRTS